MPTGTAADAAAGQPLDLDAHNEASADLGEPPQDLAVPDENADAEGPFYKGAAADAAAAAEVTAAQKAAGKQDQKKDGEKDFEAGGEIAMPAAVDITLFKSDRHAATDSMVVQAATLSRDRELAFEEQPPGQDQAPLLRPDETGREADSRPDMPAVEVTSSTAPQHTPSPLGCFQLAESAPCAGCPVLQMDRQEQFSRDAQRTRSEHYDHVGVSALTIPEDDEYKGDDPQAYLFSQNQSELQIPPPPGQGDSRSSAEAPAPAEAAAPEHASLAPADPAKVVAEETGREASAQDVEGLAPQASEVEASVEEGLEGEWLNEGQLNILESNRIIFASGEIYDLKKTSETTCEMTLDSEIYFGRLAADRKTLMWSDGDIWTRVEVSPSQQADGPRSAAVAPEGGAKAVSQPETASPEATPASQSRQDANGTAENGADGVGKDDKSDKKGKKDKKDRAKKEQSKDTTKSPPATPPAPKQKGGLCRCLGGKKAAPT
mmetsp:Transcript_149130/g.263400  ORF Transcript_149130/g.263400 Transcript_149130/m.263400 type:complete len:490 (+) Transcript_149130:126-1595(+)